jgi:hypothetical protein
MATNFEVRLLLELWNFDDIPTGHGSLNKRLTGKNPLTGEDFTALEKNTAREKLMTEGRIVLTTKGELNGFVLTDSGKEDLADALVTFEFPATIISTRVANALLKWFRSNPVTSAEPVAKTVGNAVESYEAFKVVALETFDRLNKEQAYGGLIPIWHMREEVNTAVSRSQFNDWMMQMQAEQLVYLQTGEAIGATDQQKRDSIDNEIRGLLFYVGKPI